MTNHHIAVREALLRRVDDLPPRPYPTGLVTFASCHPSFSEAREVDRLFFGRTVDQVDWRALRRGNSSVSSFLEVPVMLYFLPRLLREMLAHPYSAFTANGLLVYGAHLTSAWRLNRGIYCDMTLDECELAIDVIAWLRLLRPVRARFGLNTIRERGGDTILAEKRKTAHDRSDDHPSPLGPWNQGVLHEDWVHLSIGPRS